MNSSATQWTPGRAALHRTPASGGHARFVLPSLPVPDGCGASCTSAASPSSSDSHGTAMACQPAASTSPPPSRHLIPLGENPTGGVTRSRGGNVFLALGIQDQTVFPKTSHQVLRLQELGRAAFFSACPEPRSTGDGAPSPLPWGRASRHAHGTCFTHSSPRMPGFRGESPLKMLTTTGS